jgi:hypothetical protein
MIDYLVNQRIKVTYFDGMRVSVRIGTLSAADERFLVLERNLLIAVASVIKIDILRDERNGFEYDPERELANSS